MNKKTRQRGDGEQEGPLLHVGTVNPGLRHSDSGARR